jgi:hypothetical protein
MQQECYEDKCYKKKQNMVFVEYINKKPSEDKNYTIIYKCRHCKTEYAKLMSDKHDINPDWLICVDSDKCLIPNRFL